VSSLRRLSSEHQPIPRMCPCVGGPLAGELRRREGFTLITERASRVAGPSWHDDGSLPLPFGTYRRVVTRYKLRAFRPHLMAAVVDCYVVDGISDDVAHALYGEFFTGGDELSIDPDAA
jgi:hypothetical protein